MLLIDKKGGWNKLSTKDINNIRSTYLKLKSIEKTSKKLNFSKVTVNKYVKDLSVKDKRSRYYYNPVLKIDFKTGKILREFKNSNMAAKLCHVSLSNLNHCLNGRTNSAGGFCWCYKSEKNNFKLPTKINQWYSRQEDILLGLL